MWSACSNCKIVTVCGHGALSLPVSAASVARWGDCNPGTQIQSHDFIIGELLCEYCAIKETFIWVQIGYNLQLSRSIWHKNLLLSTITQLPPDGHSRFNVGPMALINNFLDCRTIYLIGDILHQIVTVGGRWTVELQTKCREDWSFTLMVRRASSRAFPNTICVSVLNSHLLTEG